MKIIILAFAVLLLAGIASAEFLACFQNGEIIKYCNPDVNYNRCHNNNGCACDDSMGCVRCMASYDELGNCYNQGNINVCNRIPQECSNGGGGIDIDTEAPNITLNSPLDNAYYPSKSILFSVNLSETGGIYYLDNINGRGQWTRVCTNCYGWQGNRNFNEGFNNITIKATDAMGNTAFDYVAFYIDSKKPKISKILPKANEFIGSEFTIVYSEDNLKEIKIHYGNSLTGFGEEILQGCSSGKKQNCSIELSLNDYDNQQIEYYFTIKDIADSVVESKHVFVNVDETFPVILNENFWSQGTGSNNKYIYFNISIEERNFDSILYRDNMNSWKKLCNRLRNNECVAKKSFSTGYHSVDLQVIDKAGNAIAERIEFTV